MSISAEDFVVRLRACAPSARELFGEGLSGEDVREIKSVFECQPRNVIPDPGGGEVHRLRCLFDCSQVEVGIIRFGWVDPTGRFPSGTIAVAESDPLVVADDGVVFLVDHATGERNFDVAASEGAFLEALVLLAEAFRSRVAGSFDRDDFVRRSVAAAGGEHYATLWKALLPA